MTQEQTFQRSNVFRDFDLSFNKHPLQKDVSVKTDVNAINQSLRSLINTNYYERLFQPDVGCNIRALLFEPADLITIADIKQAITDTITNHEPRVNLLELIVEDQSEANSYLVKITYTISYKNEPITFDLILERLR